MYHFSRCGNPVRNGNKAAAIFIMCPFSLRKLFARECIEKEFRIVRTEMERLRCTFADFYFALRALS